MHVHKSVGIIATVQEFNKYSTALHPLVHVFVLFSLTNGI